MIVIGNKEEIENMETRKEVLLDFHATWCGPCRMLAPVLEEIAEELDFDIVKIDIDEEEAFAKKFGIMVVPTLVLLKEGKEIQRKSGFSTKEDLEKWLKSV